MHYKYARRTKRLPIPHNHLLLPTIPQHGPCKFTAFPHMSASTLLLLDFHAQETQHVLGITSHRKDINPQPPKHDVPRSHIPPIPLNQPSPKTIRTKGLIL